MKDNADQPVTRVLVVDDEPELRKILVHFIETLGLSAGTAEDGEEAMQILIRESYDVVISDIMMPQMDGISLLQKLNSRGWRKPFILLTGHGSQELARQALQLGAYDFVEKPFDQKHLKSVMLGAAKLSHELGEKGLAKNGASSEEAPVPAMQPFVNFLSLIQNSHSTRQTRQQFIDQAFDTIAFCKGAVKNLNNREARKFELGYLLRVMREMSHQAQVCCFFDLSAFCAMATECLIYFRSRPEQLTEREMVLFSGMISLIQAYLKVLDNHDSVQHLFFDLAQKMDSLCQTFAVVASDSLVANS